MDNSISRGRQASRITGAITVIGGSLVIGSQPVGAATLTVDTATDNPADGLTLREAIQTAVDGDIITFAPSLSGQTITLDNLTNGIDKITGAITVTGLGEGDLTLTSNDGNVLYVYNDGLVTITDLTIAQAPEDGVRVRDAGGAGDAALQLDRVTISASGSDNIDFDSPAGSLGLDAATLVAAVNRGIGGDDAGPVTIANSMIASNGSNGVRLDDIVGDVAISASMIESNNDVGIFFDRITGGLDVDGAMFSANDGNQIEVDDLIGTVNVADSSFADSEDDAIDIDDVDGATVVISNVTVAGGDGQIQIRGENAGTPTRPAVTVTDLSMNSDDGISLYRISSATIEDSAINSAYAPVDVSNVTNAVMLSDGSFSSDDGNSIRIFDIGGDVTVSTVTGSNAGLSVGMVDGSTTVNDLAITGESYGIGLYRLGDVTVTDVSIDSSSGTALTIRYAEVEAGPPAQVGDVSIERVTISDSENDGLYLRTVDGATTITDTEVTGSGSDGVQLYSTVGLVTLDSVTIASSNETGLNIRRIVPQIGIVNSTIVDNGTEVADNPAIEVYGGNLDIAHSTISGNGIGSGPTIEAYVATVTIDHSVVTENSGPSTGLRSLGASATFAVSNSLVPTGSGLGASNVESDTADLSPLGNFGGETQTAPPSVGSAAIDAGDPAIAGEPATDQRGEARKVGTIDIGAVEVQPSTVAISDATVDENAGVVSVEITRTGIDLPITVDVATADGTATSPDDFSAVSTQVTLPAGQSAPVSVDIPITVDTLAEPDETFDVAISNAVGASISDAEATVTILDVPPPVAALAPERFADTRSGQSTVDDDFNGDGKLAAGGSYTVQIAGRGGVPVDAKAVTMNVTAIGAESNGFVTVHPCLATPPNASSLNYTTGVNLGNEVTVPLDADGKACFFSSGAVHLTVDVVAFVPDGSRGFPVTPARLLDTRVGESTIDGVGAGRGRVPAGATERVQVAGRGGVPADAASVIVNVTAIGAAGTGFVTVHPCLPTAPNASSLNVVAGVNRGNELIAEVDANGEICLFVSTEMNLTVDVTGYVPSGTALNSVSPGRLLDTRDNGETVDGDAQGGGKPAAGSETTLQVGGRGGVPADARAAIVNVTAIGPEANGFVTVHPCLATRPSTAALNYVPGVNGGNEIVASLNADGEICLFTSASTHLAVDIVGYLA